MARESQEIREVLDVVWAELLPVLNRRRSLDPQQLSRLFEVMRTYQIEVPGHVARFLGGGRRQA